MSKKTILITGVTGFIGAKIYEALTDKGYATYGLSRTAKNDSNIIGCDLAVENIESVIEKIPIRSFDCVINLASVLATSENIRDISLLNDNIKITQNVIKVCETFNVKKIINFSSIAVYPNQDGNFSEDSVTDPSGNAECLYGLSKICSEVLFNFYLKDKIQEGIVHFRTAQVIGEGMRSDRIYKIMEQEMHQTNTITVWGNGERVSNFIRIEKLLQVVHYFIENKASGVFNLGDQNLTYKQLAEMVIADNKQKNVEIKLVDKGVKSKVIIDTTKLNKLIKLK